MRDIVPLYLLLINAAAFAIMFADKQYAKKNRWRIPEATLLSAAALGGSFGVLLGMLLFRHKTRKLKFQILVPLFLVIHLVFLFYLMVSSGIAF